MKNPVLILAMLTLAACAGKPEARPEPVVVPQPVAVAVTQPCVPDTLKPDRKSVV